MKLTFLIPFILQAFFCLGQKVKRKVESGPGNYSVSQYIYEYDSLGRTTREILTSNEDTLKYQFENLFFYDKENKLKIVIEKHTWGLAYNIYYYNEAKSLYKSVKLNSEDKQISYRLYKQSQWTEYITSFKKKPNRVQTTVLDSLGNQTNFYGWTKTRDSKDKWNYRFVNEYSLDKKLIRTEFYKSDQKLDETRTFEYNEFGLLTKEIRTSVNGKPRVWKQIRYDYYD